MNTEPSAPSSDVVMEPRLWRRDGWTARVVKNEDDDGWAVEMTRDGDPEPSLVAPWTMGRDKKNPKPLDAPSFITWVKTASEVLLRHEQQRRAALHKSVTVKDADGASVVVDLDIVPDESDPHALLTATDARGERLARRTVRPDFRLTSSTASAWVAGGFRDPG
jgi:hypothetical protein